MPTQDLELALIPHDITLCDVERNIAEIERRIDALRPEVDVIVLPELCFTGFINDRAALEAVAETNTGRCIRKVEEWSRKRGAAICGGFLARDDDGSLRNRGFIILPDGTKSFYDKRHLFCSGGESRIFAHGEQEAPTVEYKSWKLRLAVCYDIRFPVWNRCVGLDYDILIVPSNWPNSRYYSWKHLLIARAIENQVYVAGCDREGEDEYGKYVRGDSMVIDHWGYNVSELTDDGTIYAHLNAEDFTRDRKRFTPWRDSDEFTIKL